MSLSILAAIFAVLAQTTVAAASDVAVRAGTAPEVVVPPPPKCLPADDANAPAPGIVSSFPAEGQVVRPGLVIIRVTFDRPMTCGGFLGEITGLADPCPSRRQTFIQSFDHRTVRTACVTEPGQVYGSVVGGLWSPPFVSLDGQRTPPLEVRFRTSDGPAVTSAREALAEDARAHGRNGQPGADAPFIVSPDVAIAEPARPTAVAASAARVAALEPQLSLAPVLARSDRRHAACAALAGHAVLGEVEHAAVHEAQTMTCR